jgi:uncharacterized protein YbaP (TraB family)
MTLLRFAFQAVAAALAACAFATCAPAPAREPAIWRVSDADSEIWLFGSVHVLRPDVRWQGPRVMAAFDAADEFITETDASEEAAEVFAGLAQRYGTLPQGASLTALLKSAEERSRFERVARDIGLDPAALDRTRPWLAALQLSYTYAAREGHSPEAGVETVLAERARAQGKRMSFFETPEEQVRVLADLSPEDELRLLTATVDEIEQNGGALDAMDAAWSSGNVRRLQQLLDAEWTEGGEGLYEAVVLRRNRAWADEIARRLDGSGRIFVAVGAAHLVGDDSVVALLRTRGIAVEGPP